LSRLKRGLHFRIAGVSHVAFLSATRSVPELIRCCFGDDGFVGTRTWFKSLDDSEKERRREFRDKYKPDYEAFRSLPLSNARNDSDHRTGVSPARVTVGGRFGVRFMGSPTEQIPISETREMPAEFGWMQKSVPILTFWSDFSVYGKPLFETADDHLKKAQALVVKAKTLAEEVHGRAKLSCPPSDM
jgi:hypothetical protein